MGNPQVVVDRIGDRGGSTPRCPHDVYDPHGDGWGCGICRCINDGEDRRQHPSDYTNRERPKGHVRSLTAGIRVCPHQIIHLDADGCACFRCRTVLATITGAEVPWDGGGCVYQFAGVEPMVMLLPQWLKAPRNRVRADQPQTLKEFECIHGRKFGWTHARAVLDTAEEIKGILRCFSSPPCVAVGTARPVLNAKIRGRCPACRSSYHYSAGGGIWECADCLTLFNPRSGKYPPLAREIAVGLLPELAGIADGG